MTAPLLALGDLRVTFATRNGRFEAVRGIDLSIAPGEAVGIIGESGSGKSTLSRTLLGLTQGAELAGTLAFDGRPVPLDNVAALRGRAIAMVFQDPLNALDPLMRVGAQIAEAVARHDPAANRAARVAELIAQVRLPERAADSFPHEISGGMRQRVAIALALACRPRLLIADEPTTALDVTTQKDILDLIRSLRAELGMALLLITHDLGIVSALCTRVHVMVRGEFIESGTVTEVFARPQADYARGLIAAARAVSEIDALRAAAPPTPAPMLEMRGVEKTFRLRDGSDYKALTGIDLAIGAGETLALVGESGSGKSTLARVALGLIAPDAGDVRIAGQSLVGARPHEMRAIRTRIQPVFQDAGAAFNPRRTVLEILAVAIRLADPGLRDVRGEALRLLDQVRLSPGEALLGRRPHELSGGQRQRLGIARALAAKPALIVADEPLSGADVSTRARVIELLSELQERAGVAYLFVTHDLFLARSFAHRVAVMHRGVIVEHGTAERVTGAPTHDYTRQLVRSTLPIDA